MTDRTTPKTSLISHILELVSNKTGTPCDQLEADTDLFAAGLDSITLMALVAYWQSLGHEVNFSSLAKTPTANDWAALLNNGNAKIVSTLRSKEEIVAAPLAKQSAPFPLAPMQYAYWLGRDARQPLGGVSAHLYCEFQSSSATATPLQSERLSKALSQLLQRHASLRLTVNADGKQQHLESPVVTKLIVNDWRKISDDALQENLSELRRDWSTQILDVDNGTVMTIAISLMPNDHHRLHLDIDMMAADAVSYRTLLKELAQLCEDPEYPLPELPISYRDCRIHMDRRWKSVEQSSGVWWQQRLESLPEGPELPLKSTFGDHPVTQRRHFQFVDSLKDALYDKARRHGLTPASVLATVLAETLAGWSKQPEFLINVPLFLRPQGSQNLSNIVGDFSSSVMLPVDMTVALPFVRRAKIIQAELHECAAHADYNGVQVLRDLGRLKGRQVIAPIVFTSALNLGELFHDSVRRVFGDPIWIISQGPQVLLDTQVTELNGGILMNWDCREDAFIDGVLDEMFLYFKNTVQELAADDELWHQALADRLPENRTFSTREVPLHDMSTQRADCETIRSPNSAIETVVASIWAEVTGDHSNNVNRNIFAAGGDSVLAGNLVTQLREVFGVDALDMKDLFSAPSIAGLAASIEDSGDPVELNQTAEIYCEILSMDDETLLASLEETQA